ncbi:hypothetical protein QO004_002968 [Rhizobium mesoamericanum]|nr:hypothetical protein [Rhizobium mesoamericanum]
MPGSPANSGSRAEMDFILTQVIVDRYATGRS